MTGYAYYAALRAALDASGARLHLHSPVRRLVTDRTGKVIGVEAAAIPQARWNAHQKIYRKLNPLQPYAGRKKARAVREAAAFESGCGERRLVRARRGIILATGGFIYNPDMLRHHRPLYADASRALMFIGSMGCDGSGIDLGRSVGAETQLMDRIFTGRSITPPAAFPQGILVDGQGGRFINEDAYAGFIGEAIGALPGGKAWLILDRATFRRALKECLFAGRGLYLYTLPSLVNILLGGTRKAASLRALAGKCGMDADALEASVAANNAAAQGAASDAFGKSPAATRPIAQGPFRAINMDLDNKFMVTMCFSLGGLTVDEQSGAVRRADGSAVAGLYGAGRVAVGLCSQGYISGMSLADTVFSGRRAARAIMAGQGLPDRAGAAQTTVMPPSTTSADPIM